VSSQPNLSQSFQAATAKAVNSSSVQLMKMANLEEEYLLKWNSHNSELVTELHHLCKVNTIHYCHYESDEDLSTTT